MRTEELLRALGVTPNYKGLQATVESVNVAMEDPRALCLVTKRLYPLAAKRCGMNWKQVERNIRTVISIAWEANPELLSKVAGYDITTKPKTGTFIGMLSTYLKNQGA